MINMETIRLYYCSEFPDSGVSLNVEDICKNCHEWSKDKCSDLKEITIPAPGEKVEIRGIEYSVIGVGVYNEEIPCVVLKETAASQLLECMPLENFLYFLKQFKIRRFYVYR